jgi:adenylate kinase family enzyme
LTGSLQRVVVIGTSCAGKTSFAAELAKKLCCPHIELDALHWLPDWVERSDDEFRREVHNAVATDAWVVDGNYGVARDLVWPRATTVIWLNYSFPVVLGRAVRRTFRRAVTQEELYSGNRESLRRAFFHRDSILLWVITTFHRRRKQFVALRAEGEFPHLNWLDFRFPRDAQRFLRSLSGKTGPSSSRRAGPRSG